MLAVEIKSIKLGQFIIDALLTGFYVDYGTQLILIQYFIVFRFAASYNYYAF